MKVEELYEKAEAFFGMRKDKQNESAIKREELISLLEEKIDSMKEKVKDTDEIEEKDALKKEIEVLAQLKKDCEIDVSINPE